MFLNEIIGTFITIVGVIAIAGLVAGLVISVYDKR